MASGGTKTVSFHTLGCKMNQAETEALRAAFAARGYAEAPFGERADVCVVNSCTVTGKTEHQCRQMLHRAIGCGNGSPVVVATGCYAQVDPDGLRELVPNVNLIIGNTEKMRLVDIVEGYIAGRETGQTHVDDIMGAGEMRPPLIERFTGLTRAFLRVQDGCNNRCAYCIIPYARGPSRSMPIEQALEQARIFAKNGHREIVVTGIHVGRYGRDFNPRSSLAALLRALHDVPGIERIRLSSMDPGEFSLELFEALSLPKICPHFHISLQSGDSVILKHMRRAYSPEQFANVVETLRGMLPDVCIGADVIVGFPGEDDVAFRRTHDFVERLALSYLHVFRYSRRPGTTAADMPNQVQEEIKKQRSVQLRALRNRLIDDFRRGFEGRETDVLFEHRRLTPERLLTGITGNYIRVFASGPDTLMGRIARVQLGGPAPGGMQGNIITPET
jgi:threonylcarbamoyladenosine tRNA methylthiotransferase MtaB